MKKSISAAAAPTNPLPSSGLPKTWTLGRLCLAVLLTLLLTTAWVGIWNLLPFGEEQADGEVAYSGLGGALLVIFTALLPFVAAIVFSRWLTGVRVSLWHVFLAWLITLLFAIVLVIAIAALASGGGAPVAILGGLLVYPVLIFVMAYQIKNLHESKVRAKRQ